MKDLLQSIEILPEAEVLCPLHGKYSATIKTLHCLDGRKIYTPCPQCQEERLELERKKAEARQALIRIARLKRMNIGRRDYEASFENFDAYTPELKRHLTTAGYFAEHPEGKLLMLGANGTGKNHLAAAILKQTGGLIVTALEVAQLIRLTYKGGTVSGHGMLDGAESESEILDRLNTVNLLVIDEVGRHNDSEWNMHWLSYVVNARHKEMLPMIFISNTHLKDDCPGGNPKGCSRCLQTYLDDDVISRICEDGITMKFTGDDYRNNIGNNYRNSKREQINTRRGIR